MRHRCALPPLSSAEKRRRMYENKIAGSQLFTMTTAEGNRRRVFRPEVATAPAERD